MVVYSFNRGWTEVFFSNLRLLLEAISSVAEKMLKHINNSHFVFPDLIMPAVSWLPLILLKCKQEELTVVCFHVTKPSQLRMIVVHAVSQKQQQ